MRKLLFVLILFCAAVFAGEPFYFVQISDTHFGDGDNAARSRAVVAAVNALPMKIEFVAVSGDMMHAGNFSPAALSEAKEVFGTLNMPVHFVPGNHDLRTTNLAERAAAFTNSFSPLLYSKEYGGVEFVFVCTEPLTGKGVIDGFDPLNEFEQLLQSAPEMPRVVIHHTPSVDDFFEGQVFAGWGKTAAGKRWVELLNDYQVKGVLAGHFHRDEFHWLGGVPLYVCPPVSGWLNRQAAFRIFKYCDGQLSYRTQYVD